MHIAVSGHAESAHPLNQHPGHLRSQRLHLPHEHIPLCELAPAPYITPIICPSVMLPQDTCATLVNGSTREQSDSPAGAPAA